MASGVKMRVRDVYMVKGAGREREREVGVLIFSSRVCSQ